MKRLTFLPFVLLTFSTAPCFAVEPIFSDWLDLSPGSQGQHIGAKVLDVENSDKSTIIDIQLPHDSDIEPDNIDVQAENKQFIKQSRKPSTLMNEEGEPYGIRLYLKKSPGFQFRLRILDESLIEKEHRGH